MHKLSRRQFIGYGVATGGLLAVSACSSSPSDGGRAGTATTAVGPDGPPGIEGGVVITDRSEFPSRFRERPEFAEMVEAGKLPPVAERIGEDPLVIRPVESIGEYGGTIRRAFTGVSDFQNANNFCAGPDGLLYWDYKRVEIIPNLARDYEMDPEGTELILHLRRGMRWSDGEPFTADDIVFWRDEINLNPDIGAGAPGLRVAGQRVAVERVDDFTVRYKSPVPLPLLPQLLASTRELAGLSAGGMTGDGGYAPKHYLSQFLPAYSSLDAVNRLAADEGVEGYAGLVKLRMAWHLNPDLPLLTPWVVTRPINNPPWQFGPNPYSIWVDTDGNQLPYIGEITMDNVEQLDIVTLRASAGDLDFQDRHLQVATMPILIENERRSGCTLHRTTGEDVDFGIRINLAYDADPVIGELIRTTDFRRALSLGIDRDQINEAFFLGTETPTATMVPDFSPYFPGDEWRTKWATLDVEQGNELLDGIGLTTKDGDGFRIRPDGNGRITLDYSVSNAFADFAGIGEMIRGQWQAIGIDMSVQQSQGQLLVQRAIAGDLILSGHLVGSSDPYMQPGTFLPTVTNNYSGMIGIPYARWFASNGAEGTEPPPALQKLKDAMELLSQGLQVPEDERIEIGKQLYMLHADEVWTIGIVGFGVAINGLYYAKDTLGNVPETALNSIHMKTPSNLLAMTFFYKES